MEVKFINNTYKTRVLCDSGNLLKDIMTGKSVILISEKSDLGKAIKNVPDIYKRYIPFKGVNSEGLLKGIEPENLVIDGRQYVAILATVENNFAGYEGCVPLSLL